MWNSKRKKGFTVIELIIAMTILSFVVGIFYTLSDNNIKFFSQKSNQINSDNEIRTLSIWIAKDLKNTVSDDVQRESDGSYTIGKIRYKMILQGQIKNRKVFKLVRESEEEKIELITSIAEGNTGFNIDIPTKAEPYYNVRITIVDKFNKDKDMSFKVSEVNNKISLNGNIDGQTEGNKQEESITKSSMPFVDVNDNGIFDSLIDYRIEYTSSVSEEASYDTRQDSKYQSYKASTGRNLALIFDSDFSSSSDKNMSFYSEGKIIINKDITITSNRGLKLTTLSTMSCTYATLQANKGDFTCNVSGSMGADYCKITSKENSSIKIRVGGAFTGTYGTYISEGSNAFIDINVGGAVGDYGIDKIGNVKIY